MAQRQANPPWIALTAPAQRVVDRIKRWRKRPPTSGVREPRRPKPSLPSLAVALDEPRTGLLRWIKLTGRRDNDHL
jgi:hypothetical protein